MNKPSIIFADEPSGNLGPEVLKNYTAYFSIYVIHLDQTFVLVTHNEQLAEMADRKLTMVDGLIVDSM